MDVWGRIYMDEWEGRSRPHGVERDDGIQETFDSAQGYFEAPRTDGERELLERIQGPVLDLGCGPGSYALHLQERGLEVTAGDASPLAVEVCRARGCRDARVMDLRDPGLPEGSYGAVTVMGNTLGAHQTPETFPAFLRTLHQAVRPGGHLLCATVDPLETEDPRHLAYHEANRAKGLPPGLTTIRMTYGELVDEWVKVWLLTDDELGASMDAAGWELEERRREGAYRVDLYLRGALPAAPRGIHG